MYIYYYKKQHGISKTKILGITIYKKYQSCGYTIRKYFANFVKIKINSINKKIYVLGIQVYSRSDKFKKLENYINTKLQEYKVKQQKMLSVAFLHSKVFPQFKGVHLNDSIVIIGCGPSLSYYEPNSQNKHIALNRAISYDKVHFDYYFCTDARDDMRQWLSKYSNYNCKKFYGQHFNFITSIDNRGCANIPESDAIRDNAYRFYSNAFDMEFYQDISTCPLMDYGSIAFCAAQFALYTMPKKIYLVGCDCTNNGYFNNTSLQQPLRLNKVINGYKKLKFFAQIYYPDIEIISVNPVGLKGMFKDVYTQSYVDEHPELLNENIEILKQNEEKELINK